MQIQQNISLKNYSTMRLGGTAAYLSEAESRTEISELVAWAAQYRFPIRVIGMGSNIVWRDEGFPGLVIVNKMERFEDYVEEDFNHYVTIGAGENWDSAVARTVDLGLTGIEALSLIPGTTGATPVQNVGAYGQDVSQTISSIEVYDLSDHTFKNLTNTDCAFGYRSSRFNQADQGKFIITAVTFHLTKTNPQPPFYGAVEQYFQQKNITAFTPAILREAVIAIRSAKLPDPAKVANNGSFFANPIVEQITLESLQDAFPDIPHWDTDTYGYFKIPAAWLIEQAGFKDFHDAETGMATWATQPLVLINEKAQSTTQLLAFKQKIIDAVQSKFGIILQQEPELLP